MRVSVRDMTPADASEVYAIEIESFTAPWSKDSLCCEIGADRAVSRVAILDGHIVGYVMAQYVIDEAQLTHIAISKAHRRRGVAKLLMNDLISILRKIGVKKIFLEARVSNIAAISLYKNIGFITCMTRKNYYTNPIEDAVVMMMDI